MFDLLSRYKGNQIVVELASGKQLAGTVIDVGPQDMRMETGAGTCVILISAIQAIWEKAPGLDQGCNQIYTMPCAEPYGCFEQYNGQPCPQQFGHCPQRFAAPCFNFFYESEPHGTPCYYNYGYIGRPCHEVFGGFPYPYSPYPYYEQTEGMAGQTHNKAEIEQEKQK